MLDDSQTIAGEENAGADELEFVVEAHHAGVRLDRFLQEVTGVSRSQVQLAIREGRVLLEGVTAAKTGVSLKAGMEILYTPARSLDMALTAQDLGLEFLYTDQHMAVVNKASGVVVHPAPGHWDSTVVNGLLHCFPELAASGERPGIVHRLDVGTSGVLLVGRSQEGREGLMAQFLAKRVFKGYLAVVCGVPGADWGTIDRPISRHPADRKRYSSTQGQGRDAVTLWRRLASNARYSLLAVRILTGRTHQIRVHLGDSGWPVAADPIYGKAREPLWGRLPESVFGPGPLLHAACIALEHPVTRKPVEFTAPLPQRWLELLEQEFPAWQARLASGEALGPLFPSWAGSV